MKAVRLWICLTILESLATICMAKPMRDSMLNIGEKLPRIEWQHVLHDKDGILNTDDLRGKLVIFDFWNVHCGSCIAAMPNMQKIQEKFGDKVQIILVTEDTQQEVDQLFERSAIARNTKLPFVIGDTVLTRLFEFRTFPTHAWIDENGRLKYFTSGANASEANIEKYLNGTDIDLAFKKEYSDFDIYASLLQEGGGRQQKHIKYYSLISERIDDNSTGAVPMRHGNSIRFVPWQKKFVNMSIIDLYKIAFHKELSYAHGLPIADQFIAAQTIDSDRFYIPAQRDKWDAWRKGNTFCYEICVPKERQVNYIISCDMIWICILA